MSATSDLTTAQADLTAALQALTQASTAVTNAKGVMRNPGGLTSLQNASGDITRAQTLAAITSALIGSALVDINPPPSPQPSGPAGAWTLAFADDFTSLNTSVWTTHDGWTNQNGVTDHASNVSINGSNVVLTLASETSGAALMSITQTLAVGQYAEARIDFAGNGTTVYDWPAWWTSGPNWPQAGENDIAEGLGTLTINYHSPLGANNTGTVAGVWVNGFHTFGIHRLADHCDVYYDGVLDRTYPTHDNGAPESLILTIGYGGGPFTPAQLLIDWVKVWSPA